MSVKDFWKGAGERAGKTALQAFVGTMGLQSVGVITPHVFGVLPWETSLLTGLVLGFLSIVTSLLNPSFTSGSSAVSDDSDDVSSLELSPFDPDVDAKVDAGGDDDAAKQAS